MARLLDILFSNGVTLADLGSLRVCRGETLIEQDSPSAAVYFVVAGRFRVERDNRTIGYIEAGSVVGEIGFFTGAARTATVVAFRDSLVLRLTRSEYEDHCARHPDFRDGLIAELASRFAERFSVPDVERMERIRPRTLALLVAGDGTLPGRFIEHLGAALGTIRAAQLISFAAFTDETGGAEPDSFEGVDWFSRTERARDLTIYLPDPAQPDWQRAIVRQSDQVLIVGTAGAPPELSPVETFAIAQIPREQRRLVLLHRRRRASVHGTAAWLHARPVGMHHHIATTDDRDIRRLARFLAGTAVGLVLSGGGAYGVAHIGIHNALSGAGMGFDIFGGTSVGSAMGAAFALGISGDDLADKVADIFVHGSALRRVTVPRYSLLDHKAFDAKLVEHFGDLDIADMWMPYYAVATDLNTNRPDVIRYGPLWQAIRASSALPGILPPFIRKGGDLLVDGGILDNLPYRAMRELKAGPNVVASLARNRARSEGYEYNRIPGRAGLLLDMLRPGSWRDPPAPGVTETIIRSMMAGQSYRAGDLGPQDWLITPPLAPEMGFMNWRDAFGLIGPAQEYARDHLTELAATDPTLHRALLRAGPGQTDDPAHGVKS